MKGNVVLQCVCVRERESAHTHADACMDMHVSPDHVCPNAS